jgi:NhaP-type Na+/H+ or K+/H+ antiporter
MNRERRTIWQLRVLMGIGVLILVFDFIEPTYLGLQIPWYMSIYLVVASFYFAANAQKMVMRRSEEMLTYFFFPGAFVTALIPAYAITLFFATYTTF